MKTLKLNYLNTTLSLIFVSILVSSCKGPGKEQGMVLEYPEQQNYRVEEVVANLNNPWGMDWLPDGSMLITEKSGQLIHYKDNKKLEVNGLPTDIYVSGQGGLLDIRLHPDYKENGWIYFTYASSQGEGRGGNTKLIRARLEANSLTGIETLYKAGPNTTKGQHFGSRIAFDTNGYVYFSVGDRGDRDTNPQDISRDCGKVYRLHDDGRIPADNPFVNVDKAKKAIYSYGHRNPQGMAMHPVSGKIWIHEHGPKGGDEVNIIKKGANYGWPVISYGINYSGTKFTEETARPGMEQPIHYWVPSIAPCGMTFVQGDLYPDWKGDLLVGSLKFGYVELLELKGEKVTGRKRIAQDIGRTRNVKQGPDGYIYVAVEGRGIFKLVPR
jgi:glucose/arabinose dehydrogenase